MKNQSTNQSTNKDQKWSAVKLLNLKTTAMFFLILFLTTLASQTYAWELSLRQKSGYILNDSGDKCWFTQIVKKHNTYFHEFFKTDNAIVTFDDPTCMTPDEYTIERFGLDLNKEMINWYISRKYSPNDADFLIKVSKLFNNNGLLMQIRGKCMQSKKYDKMGISVDYFVENNSITGFIFGMNVSGCSNALYDGNQTINEQSKALEKERAERRLKK